MTPVCNHCAAAASTVLLSGMGAFFLCPHHDVPARVQSEVVPEGAVSGWVIVTDVEVTRERG